MQVLVLQLGSQEYALETRHVVRVLPALTLTLLPHAPAFIGGVMNYHGAPVPVIDLRRITASPDDMTEGMGQRLSGSAFDCRILLIDHPSSGDRRRLLGLRAEHVIGIRRIDPEGITHSGIHDAGTPFLGNVVISGQSVLQMIEPADLLPAHVQEWLFDASGAAAC